MLGSGDAFALACLKDCQNQSRQTEAALWACPGNWRGGGELGLVRRART